MKVIGNLICRRTGLHNEELLVVCGVIKTTPNMMRDAVQMEQDKCRGKHVIENFKERNHFGDLATMLTG